MRIVPAKVPTSPLSYLLYRDGYTQEDHDIGGLLIEFPSRQRLGSRVEILRPHDQGKEPLALVSILGCE